MSFLDRLPIVQQCFIFDLRKGTMAIGVLQFIISTVELVDAFRLTCKESTLDQAALLIQPTLGTSIIGNQETYIIEKCFGPFNQSVRIIYCTIQCVISFIPIKAAYQRNVQWMAIYLYTHLAICVLIFILALLILFVFPLKALEEMFIDALHLYFVLCVNSFYQITKFEQQKVVEFEQHDVGYPQINGINQQPGEVPIANGGFMNHDYEENTMPVAPTTYYNGQQGAYVA